MAARSATPATQIYSSHAKGPSAAKSLGKVCSAAGPGTPRYTFLTGLSAARGGHGPLVVVAVCVWCGGAVYVCPPPLTYKLKSLETTHHPESPFSLEHRRFTGLEPLATPRGESPAAAGRASRAARTAAGRATPRLCNPPCGHSPCQRRSDQA